MAGEASVIREEIWFDSSDGTSRIHGYIWWPPGVSGEAEGDGPDERVSADPGQPDPQPSVAGEAQEGAACYHPTQRDADDARRDAHSDPAPETDEHETGNVSPANALEAAARSTLAQRRSNAFEAAARRSAAAGDEDQDETPPSDDASEGPACATSQEDLAPGEPDASGEDAPTDDERDGTPEDRQGDTEADGLTQDEDELPLVKGVVQIVHGMAEYVGRYDEFARFLAGNGYVVCGHDHICHGGSAPRERWGKLPSGSKRVLIADVGRLRALMGERLGVPLPHFLFGHSLGSFVVRAYIAREGEGLAGAVICGTGHVSFAKSEMGNLASHVLGLVHHKSASPLLTAMGTGAYTRSVRHRRTDNDWLSFNEKNVDAYNADEQCGFEFSPGGYATVTSLTREVCTLRCAKRVPRRLPLLFIGGDSDPVGDDGDGVRAAAHLARVAGSADVTCMIYRHMRHEILNETDRHMVFDDILFWLEVRSWGSDM